MNNHIRKESIGKLSPRSAASAIEDNVYTFFAEIGKNRDIFLHMGHRIKWIDARPSVWPNYLFDARFDTATVDQSIRLIKSHIERREAPAQWFIGPGLNSVELDRSLRKNGFNSTVQWPGMAVELLKMNTGFHGPDRLTIETVRTEESLALWVEIVSRAMFGNGFMSIELFRNFLTNKKVYIYLAFLNKTAVATSLLFISSGIGGLFLISTLPEYRNRGIGKAMTLAPLLDARKLGYRIGGLFATQLGEVIYRKIGFEQCCNFEIYQY
jgi:ribosomal protein S18 acetylase RimI-like enzyme